LNSDGTTTYVPMRVNNSNLNEDLGCIDYIFSDKTGTLTQNSMNMANWWCDGFILDEMKEPGIVFKTLKAPSTPASAKTKMEEFLLALSLCHGCIPSWDEKRNEFIYESQSPDETALLIAARTNKYKLTKRSKQFIQVEVNGTNESFELLNVIEFNSTRKRMSVIVKTKKGIRLYSKGADNIMMARLAKSSEQNDPGMVKKAEDALIQFSNIGLRTLVIAYRDLTQKEFDQYKKQYDEAEIALEGREEKIGLASDLVETELTLIGCTAIEDKLQDLVPETIENCLNAGIKLWLLTGDKQETAINIGLSSRLINKTMKLLILSASSREACNAAMDAMIAEQQAARPVS
jgi:phospholipid-transporting ATPase